MTYQEIYNYYPKNIKALENNWLGFKFGPPNNKTELVRIFIDTNDSPIPETQEISKFNESSTLEEINSDFWLIDGKIDEDLVNTYGFRCSNKNSLPIQAQYIFDIGINYHELYLPEVEQVFLDFIPNPERNLDKTLRKYLWELANSDTISEELKAKRFYLLKDRISQYIVNFEELLHTTTSEPQKWLIQGMLFQLKHDLQLFNPNSEFFSLLSINENVSIFKDNITANKVLIDLIRMEVVKKDTNIETFKRAFSISNFEVKDRLVLKLKVLADYFELMYSFEGSSLIKPNLKPTYDSIVKDIAVNNISLVGIKNYQTVKSPYIFKNNQYRKDKSNWRNKESLPRLNFAGLAQEG